VNEVLLHGVARDAIPHPNGIDAVRVIVPHAGPATRRNPARLNPK
jgi:hypothetical protein